MNNVKFVASVNRKWFKNLASLVGYGVKKAGEWRTFHNSKANEIFTCAIDADDGVGKKFCLTNIMENKALTVKKKKNDKSVPGYA